MNFRLATASINEIQCDTLIVGIFQEDNTHLPPDGALTNYIHSFTKTTSGCSDYGQIHSLAVVPASNIRHIILVGLGVRDMLTLDKIRMATANAVRSVRMLGASVVASYLHGSDIGRLSPDCIAEVMVEGALLGSYQFLYYKTASQKPVKQVQEFVILQQPQHDSTALQAAIDKAVVIAGSVNFTRDLVNHPGCYLTPARLAWYAEEIGKNSCLTVNILDGEHIAELKMGALLAVAQGSAETPRMITLRYQGAPDSTHTLAYVGKGITFDSGGISIKPSANMDEMKGDMAGAAAVLGAMRAIAALKPAVNILAVIPCAENMPSGQALKPGDVITSMAGHTIEVINTDAEGRLVLADAITYAKQLGASSIVDVATLTGACVVALGHVASAVCSNHAEWCAQVLAAAAHCDEKMWQLPIYDEYKEEIKSDIADVKNSGGRPAGTITAALFLEMFAERTPWVHIDIAGTSDTTATKGYQVKGATGVAVRTLVQLALQYGEQL